MKIGFIEHGNMGGALARAAAKGGHTLLLANRTPAKAEALAKELGGTVCPNAEAAETAELLFLGVKPQGLPGLAGELAPVLQARKGNAPVVVSMATAVTLRELDAMLGGGLPLIRIMPNTPAAVGAGTILYAAQNVTDAQLNAFRAALAQAGLLLPLPEAQIDAASAISGSRTCVLLPVCRCAGPRRRARGPVVPGRLPSGGADHARRGGDAPAEWGSAGRAENARVQPGRNDHRGRSGTRAGRIFLYRAECRHGRLPQNGRNDEEGVIRCNSS